jgi:hypothetical protein
MVDENNMLTLRCRVICQENGAAYIPHLRIISTKDGEISHPGLYYEIEESPLDNTCNSERPTRDYEYRITALSDTFNESIAMCGLFYRSESESVTELCHVPSIVWIILPERPTMMPNSAPTVGGRIGPIPEGVSIFFIIMAAVCTCIITGVLIGGVVFLYKRAAASGKTPKRKISAQVTYDGSAATRPHRGGSCTLEDMESGVTSNSTSRC